MLTGQYGAGCTHKKVFSNSPGCCGFVGAVGIMAEMLVFFSLPAQGEFRGWGQFRGC